MKKLLLIVTLVSVSLGASAQMTYQHDSSKKNQITVGEVGTGSLSPDVYYWVLHNRYRKDAAVRNKLSFRTTAGIGAYGQIDDAEKLDSALLKRAEVEALNMADREVDVAWAVEGKKITDKMAHFLTNINRITRMGGSASARSRWFGLYQMYGTAINATKEAYMPNADRKREYLAIYADLLRQNETLVRYLVQLSNSKGASELLYASATPMPDNKKLVTAEAYQRWRETGWAITVSQGDNGGGPGGKWPWVRPGDWHDWTIIDEEWIKQHPEYLDRIGQGTFQR